MNPLGMSQRVSLQFVIFGLVVFERVLAHTMACEDQPTIKSVLLPSQTNLVSIYRPRRDEMFGWHESGFEPSTVWPRITANICLDSLQDLCGLLLALSFGSTIPQIESRSVEDDLRKTETNVADPPKDVVAEWNEKISPMKRSVLGVTQQTKNGTVTS
ncbi:hypothetical protein RB195_017525 [Necator americanus]|uniref:Uncharacterized protein n=1 Tax=Necator americanus TaxID=51031 RepID=A0ABR1C9A1_NECAM